MNIENMKTVELKEIARDLKVKNWWTLKKAELIAAIQEAQNESEDTEEVADEEVIAENEEAAQNDADTSEEAAEEPAEEKPAKKPRGKMIEYNGESKNLNQWAKELGLSGQTLFARIYISNWPIEKAFTTPTKKKKDEEEA